MVSIHARLLAGLSREGERARSAVRWLEMSLTRPLHRLSPRLANQPARVDPPWEYQPTPLRQATQTRQSGPNLRLVVLDEEIPT